MGCTLQYVPSGLSLYRRQGSLGSLGNLGNLGNLGRTILNFLNLLNLLNLPNFLISIATFILLNSPLPSPFHPRSPLIYGGSPDFL